MESQNRNQLSPQLAQIRIAERAELFSQSTMRPVLFARRPVKRSPGFPRKERRHRRREQRSCDGAGGERILLRET
jgi:hypothetical protein